MAVIIQQLLFALLVGTAAWVMTKRVKRLIANVQLGKAWLPEPAAEGERWKKVALFAFGQKKMFDNLFVGVMHFVIYAGFFIINLEILEIILDGLFGTHRLFAPLLGATLYTFLINSFEWLAFGVLTVCVVFLCRRNLVHIKRFHARELTQWPRQDANTILLIEIGLMLAFLTWNASETVLRIRALDGLAHPNLHHYLTPILGPTDFVISSWLIGPFTGMADLPLMIYERSAWWLHISGILAFAVYVTYSKHLHIGMAFPNIYWGRTRAVGQMRNMEDVTTTVREMLGLPSLAVNELAGTPEQTPVQDPGKFGARDVTDLTWKNLMDAYSCTECGRCTAACPANITGKQLSPRKIMMDTRDRMEEIGRHQEATKIQDIPQEKPLLDGYILREEILACTSCNACVEACPITINPLDIILELRRYAVMEESKAPASWNAMFQNLENQQAPWAYPASERLKWMEQA